MKWTKFLLVLAWLAVSSLPVCAGTANIIKVLPHLLDEQGRHTLSPSLYERDAYQAILRNHPEKVSTVRFDINWKARSVDRDNLKIRVEIRSGQGGAPVVVEEKAKPGIWSSVWSGVTIPKETYQKIHEVTAWRITVWDGEQQLAEQKSFLWQ